MNQDKAFQPLRSSPKHILLVVEDSEQDYEMLLRSIKKSDIPCQVNHCETGEEAIDYLTNQGEFDDREKYPQPSFILLDLNLPGFDGKDILKKIKNHPVLKCIPTIIFTTSSNPRDIQGCYRNGANAYVIKPMDVPKLQECVTLLLKHWLKINITNVDNI